MRHSIRSAALAVLAFCRLASPGLGQGSGFQAGELVLYSPAVQGISSVDGAIVRIDPLTGQASLLLDLATTPGNKGGIAYDPFRERLIFRGRFPTLADPLQIYLMDGFGNTTPLGFEGVQLNAFAPASGGRIYMRSPTVPHFRYLDAANHMHPLLDPSGTQPFDPPDDNISAMIYDAGTNALFVAVNSNSLWDCGVPTVNSAVTRLSLSADGTRVTGAASCVEVSVTPGEGSAPVGFSRGPDGELLLVLDNNNGQTWPRMNRIDPVTLSVTPFASNGGSGAAATNAGTWSSNLQKAVILDTGNDVLRAFAFGEVGEGRVIVPSIQISGGGSGEIATLVEIRPGGCESGVGTYCQAKVTSEGCLPTITTAGSPSASAGSGFTITASELTAQQFGILFYGLDGPAQIPFQGGFRCVAAPITRLPAQNAGGSGPCAGVLSRDFNAYIASGTDPELSAGTVVHGQFWFRDPADPISGTGLTGGVTFTICP